MNNIIAIIVLLNLASALVFILSSIAFVFCDIYNSKKMKIICVISLIIHVLSTVLIIIYFTNHPQPTFREVCEANNGTYIDNNGRAGDSCIYNRQVGDNDV